MKKRYHQLFPAMLVFASVLILLGFLLDDSGNILPGLSRIITMQDLLITDYVYIAGPGAALVNAGIVTFLSICIIKFSGDPFNGYTIVEMGLMAGFSLFGKNFLNIWPIILGTWLYTRYQKEPFSKYASIALLSTTGRVPTDYLRMFGAGPVLVNIGVNGLLGITYVLIMGGDLNGPTLGGIFTIMGFSAFGKHAFNIIPVMGGVAAGAYSMCYTPNYPPLQPAGLFGTTLAPVAGHFGWHFGILAGFVHSALVLQTGGSVAGLNLYNNGFSGGLIAIVLYPTVTAIWKHRRPKLQDRDYYDLFEESDPIDISGWRTKKEHTRTMVRQPVRGQSNLYTKKPYKTIASTESTGV